VRLGGLGQNTTPTSGTELETFRLVAYCLRKLRYRFPPVRTVCRVYSKMLGTPDYSLVVREICPNIYLHTKRVRHVYVDKGREEILMR
jgi:hypothetical protein